MYASVTQKREINSISTNGNQSDNSNQSINFEDNRKERTLQRQLINLAGQNDTNVIEPSNSVTQLLKASYVEYNGEVDEDHFGSYEGVVDTDTIVTDTLKDFSVGELETLMHNIKNHKNFGKPAEIRAKHVLRLASDLYNDAKLPEHVSNSAAGWFDTYDIQPGAGDTLHDLVYNIVYEAIGDPSKIKEMSYDDVYNYKPATQLAYCLEICRDSSEAELALCMYTSYFYQPLNKYFRGQSEPDESTYFGQAVLRAAQILEGSYDEEGDTELEDPRYRMELKSGWIPDGADQINFAALTSTHPNLNGVKGMWGDVAAGTFGPYDNFALLSFEGTAKIKRPQLKYFDDESEDLMGPGSVFQVVDSYDLQGNIPKIGVQTIRVFRLSNGAEPYPPRARLSFNDIV